MDLNENFVDNENDIVISGIAGRFPESDTMDELRDNLYANRDLVSEDDRRWPLGLYGLPTRSGKLKELNRFDAQFFGFNGKQAQFNDPQGRILLEATYEAIVDSGYNPKSIRGSNTGVYIGAIINESDDGLTSDPDKIAGYGATGTKRNFLSNRVSYVFDFKGPSFTIDSACSSSLVAFQQAYSAMRVNECDMAIVGGVNITLRPTTSLELSKFNLLSPDGRCKYLDVSADGYGRSETVAALLLQKRKHAKRVYATVIHAKTNSDGYKQEGITYPSVQSQIDLMEATLKESDVNPNNISYFEAHGTGTQAGDQNESNAICKVYCKDRSEPLLIGSIKSNLGHAEASSGICSIAKMLITFENCKIPASLYPKTPNPDVQPLMEGRILPVTQNHVFNNSVVAINSFGFGGTNVHILIRRNNWTGIANKDDNKCEIPRLIVVNGRTEDSVEYVLDFIRKNTDKANDNFLALLTDVTTSEDSDGMDCHGFVVRDVSTNNYEERERRIATVGDRRQVWFICSGQGSQWTGMARGLMDIRVFSESIQHSAKILEPYGIDLMHIILSNNEDVLKPILASTVGIAAVQIALVDVLHGLGIEADGYIGHSLGELCCGYLDKGLDSTEMLLYAFWRGKCVEEANVGKGLMAAVGMTWAEAIERCPPGVVAACHNGPDSVTISGAYEEVNKFVAQLKSENIFAKTVNSCNIPFHSSYMRTVAPELLERQRSVTSRQTKRSHKWISSSVPESNWSTEQGLYSSPEYYTNNLVSPVLFEEALQFVPRNAIVVEIAPDSIFRNMTKRSLGQESSYVGLMSRKNGSNNVSHLLTSIGELFNLGLKPRIDSLYPKVTYPVKRGTQSLGSLIRWDHSDDWLVTLYPDYFNPKSQSEMSIEIDLNKEENHYIYEHCIDGRILFPATSCLSLVWEEFAKHCSLPRDQLPVILEEIRFLRPTIISKETMLSIKLNLSRINGEFHLYEGDVLTVTGRIRTSTPGEDFLPLQQNFKNQILGLNTDNFPMTKQEVYQELSIRGYYIGEYFQRILSADIDKSYAKFKYNYNWISYLDAMIQLSFLKTPTRDLLLPYSIQSIHFDPRLMASNACQESSVLIANMKSNYMLTNGIEIYGLGCIKIERKKAPQELVLEKYVWMPHFDTCALDTGMQEVIKTYLEVIENLLKNESIITNTDLMNDLNSFLVINNINSEHLVLKNIIENFNTINNIIEDQNKHLISYIDQNMSSDLLNNLYFEESLLRPVLDIVLENNISKYDQEFRVLEINLNQELCYQRVIHYLKDSFYKLRVNYSVYNPVQFIENTDNSYVKIDINFSKTTLTANTQPFSLIIIREPFPSKDSDFISYEDVFRYIDNNLEINGFVVILKRNEWSEPEKTLFTRFGYSIENILDENTLISMADRNGLSLIGHRSDTMTSSVLLFRKVTTTKATDTHIIRVTHSDIDSLVERLKNAINSYSNDQTLIWLVSDDQDLSGIIGFVNSLRREPGGHRIRCISGLPFRYLIDSTIIDNNLVMNCYKNKELGSYRYLSLNSEHMTKSRVSHAMLMPSKPNDNSMFQWIENKHNLLSETELNCKHNLLIRVFYAGLNDSDLHRESTDYSDYYYTNSMIRNDEKCLSSEFSGVDMFGNRYFGIKVNACLSTTLVVNNGSDSIEIPDEWSLAQACSVPIAYGTGYLALVIRAQLQRHQSVLIHSGEGCIGRAAIAIALSYHCIVYTTVQSVDAKKALFTEFPNLDENKIINTSLECFKDSIIEGTDGKGVNIVFDYTNEYKLDSSLFCVKHYGRYVTVGCPGLEKIRKDNITIDIINFADIFNDSTEESTKYKVLSLIKEGINANVIKPLNSRVFGSEDIREAVDYMLKNTNKDKVLVRIRAKEQNGKHFNEKNEILVNSVHKTQFSGNRSYVITGDLSGFSLELANWMVSKGAKHLLLTSTTGINNYLQEFHIKRLISLGAQVVIKCLYIENEEQCKELLKVAELLAPVGGIFFMGQVYSDELFINQSQESTQKVSAPKVLALKHLDLISRQLCPKLKYFITFSSISSGRGNGCQSTYAFFNSYSERLCELRKDNGFPALAIQWGAVEHSCDLSVSEDQTFGGTVVQGIHSCLSVLNHFLRSTDTVVTSFLRHEIQALEEHQKRDIVSIISSVLGMRDPSKIRLSSKLPELGMDSLMVIEIQQTLEREFQLTLDFIQLNDITFGDIIKITKNK